MGQNMVESGQGIAAVERFTGLSKDTLRMWERRYDFPTPDRDTNGERLYPREQIDRLRVIKRLMDAGHRPGKLVELPLEELQRLSAPAPAKALQTETAEFLNLLRRHDVERLHAHLSDMLMRGGVGHFVTRIMPDLNEAVGEAWMRGELAVFEEHLYSHHAQTVLRAAISQVRPGLRGPRIVLTSFPGEPHTLGLLMVEALFAIEGASCIPLGTETPALEIVQAAEAHRADVVALSFSAAFSPSTMFDALHELRGLLRPDVAIWAGGTGAARPRKLPQGVVRASDLDEALRLVRERGSARRDASVPQP